MLIWTNCTNRSWLCDHTAAIIRYCHTNYSANAERKCDLKNKYAQNNTGTAMIIFRSPVISTEWIKNRAYFAIGQLIRLLIAYFLTRSGRKRITNTNNQMWGSVRKATVQQCRRPTGPQAVELGLWRLSTKESVRPKEQPRIKTNPAWRTDLTIISPHPSCIDICK